MEKINYEIPKDRPVNINDETLSLNNNFDEHDLDALSGVIDKVKKNKDIIDSGPIVDDLEDRFESAVKEKEEVKTEKNSSKNKTLIDLPESTGEYTQVLLQNDFIPEQRDENLLDLGPIEEEDDIFSTPRKDAEADDFENFKITKADKRAVKKAKKHEKSSQKKLQKLLK